MIIEHQYLRPTQPSHYKPYVGFVWSGAVAAIIPLTVGPFVIDAAAVYQGGAEAGFAYQGGTEAGQVTQ